MTAPPARASAGGPAVAFGRCVAAYVEVCKPKVVAVIVFTAVVGMFLAVPGLVPLGVLLAGAAGIGLGAASGAAFNHAVEGRIDAAMARTRNRPVVSGVLGPWSVTVFACLLAGRLDECPPGVGELLTAALTPGFDDCLRGGLYGLAEARHSAEHRHRGSGRRDAAGPRVDCGDGGGGPARVAALSHHIRLDPATLLGARHPSAQRVRGG